MCFNHFPEDSLTIEQQQLLLNVENRSLTLIEECEDLVFNPAQLHNDFLTDVIIDNDELQWGVPGDDHYEKYRNFDRQHSHQQHNKKRSGHQLATALFRFRQVNQGFGSFSSFS